MRPIVLTVLALAAGGCSEYDVKGDHPSLGAEDSAPITNGATGTGTGDTTFTFTSGAGTGGGGTAGSGTAGSGTGGPGSGTGGPGSGTGGPGSGTGGGSSSGTGGSTTGTGGTGTGTPGWDECDWAQAVAGYLDALQTPNDGRVLYCHSSAGNNFVFVDSNISSCLTHATHNYDIFPTTLCDS